MGVWNMLYKVRVTLVFMSNLVWMSDIFVVFTPFSIQLKNRLVKQSSHDLDIDPPVQQRRPARRSAQQSALHLHHLTSQVGSEKICLKKNIFNFFLFATDLDMVFCYIKP